MDDIHPGEEPDVSAEWMAPIDGDIVRLMQSDEIFTPDHIADEDVCRAPDAAYRCRELTKYGLLEKLAVGMYGVTELGEQYLAGEIDPSELEPDE